MSKEALLEHQSLGGSIVSKNERQEVLRALDAWDRSVFREVTSHQSPLAPAAGRA